MRKRGKREDNKKNVKVFQSTRRILFGFAINMA